MARLRGFTLVELLVVLVIVLMVSVLAIPAAHHAHAERGVQEGARLVLAAIASARDEAARTGVPHGIRFLPDPAGGAASGRIVPIGPAPEYSEGLAACFPADAYDAAVTGGRPCLVLEQCPVERWVGEGIVPAAETNWWGNVRAGDRVRVGGCGPWHVVCGPAAVATSEGFAGAATRLARDYTSPSGKTTRTFAVEYLLLANGLDDDGDGIVDDGWDGVDNDGDGAVDEPDEWEPERWGVLPPMPAAYAIRRRPVPERPSSVVDLPAGVLVDTSGLPAEVLFDAGGAVGFPSPYASPAASATYDDAGAGRRLIRHGMVIRLADRGLAGTVATIAVDIRTGRAEAQVQSP